MEKCLLKLEGESEEDYRRRCHTFNPAEAARAMIDELQFKGPGKQSSLGLGLNHLIWMLREIAKGTMSIGKQNRWLGWAQCLAVSMGLTTLEKMKQLNQQHS